MHKLFRTINLCWAVILLAYFAIRVATLDPNAMGPFVYWLIYLAAAVGVIVDLRSAWAITIVQLLATWVLMGVCMSDHSFSFFSGASALDREVNGVSHLLTMLVLNTFMGVVAPATCLVVLLVLSTHHVRWVFRERWRPPPSRRARFRGVARR